MPKPRLRDLGIQIGSLPAGPNNAITDVADVWVGHKTLIYDQPRIARTGVTVIMPRAGAIWQDNAFAACHTFNGTGEMTGMHWLGESGLLCYPIALTNTHQVGTVHEALVAYGQENGLTQFSSLAVVAETWDGWLNDLDAFHVKRTDVYEALEHARPGPVAEGNVGGGTGMICHDFKGGIGTSSRLVEIKNQQYCVGVLVQANYGDREDLRLNGVPVGKHINTKVIPSPWIEHPEAGSIIMVIATDAPLLPGQCLRLAKRAVIGYGRTGGIGHNSSGDIFLAFATGNHIQGSAQQPLDIRMLPHHLMNPLFQAVAEAVEEAIFNALVAADTMSGFKGHKAYALPLEELQRLMKPEG